MPLPCSPQRMAVATSRSPAAAPARVIAMSKRGRLAAKDTSDHTLRSIHDGRPGIAPDRPPALTRRPLVEGPLHLRGHLGGIRRNRESVEAAASDLAKNGQVGADHGYPGQRRF